MKKTLNLPRQEQKKLLNQFPSILDINDCENADGYQKIAVSYFDHWLTEAEANMLFKNVDSAEQTIRNNKFISLSNKILANTVFYTYKLCGRYKTNPIFKAFKDPDFARNYLYPKTNNCSSKHLFKIVFPSFNALYYKGFDDTCYLYFKDEKEIQEFYTWVRDSGLFILNIA